MRFYVSQTLGDGSSGNPFRPAVDNYLQDWRAVDMRKDVTVSGRMFVECSPTAQQHTDMQADPLITYIPIEGAGGAELNYSSTLSEIPAAVRNQLRTALENRQVPIDDLTGTSTVKQLLKRIVLRLHLRGIMKADDVPDGLDSTVNTGARNRINARLAELGISGINQTTAREIIKEVASKNSKWLRTHYDD